MPGDECWRLGPPSRLIPIYDTAQSDTAWHGPTGRGSRVRLTRAARFLVLTETARHVGTCTACWRRYCSSLDQLNNKQLRGKFHQKQIAGCDYFSVGDNLFT